MEGNDIYALAATDGQKKAVMIANISEEDQTIFTNLPASMKVYVIDETHFCTLSDLSPVSFVAGQNCVYLIVDEKED